MPLQGINIIGYISNERRRLNRTAVYDGSGLAPDVSQLSCDKQMISVNANSMYGRGEKVTRPIEMLELFTIWDYEGKYESKHWSPHVITNILNCWLASPPAKMIRSFLFIAGENILLHVHTPFVPESRPSPGITSSIPFNPMEEATDTRVKAAQTYDAEVDLAQWAYPNETPRVGRATAVLRQFAVKWWAQHQEMLAMRWIESIGSDVTPEDIEAVNDCIRRVKACTYWTWTQGS